jgi:hypothetical protein
MLSGLLMRPLIETADDPHEGPAHPLDQLAAVIDDDAPGEPVAAEPDAGPATPHFAHHLRHPDRTVYILPGLFGSYSVRLCRKPPPGRGWHGHGEILRQWWTTSGKLALEVVEALKVAADPDAMLAALALTTEPPREPRPLELDDAAVLLRPLAAEAGGPCQAAGARS